MISVIVATHNEKGNIEKLVPIIQKTLSRHEHEIIIVDNSQDGTITRESACGIIRRKK